ncbi:MAG TPA: HAD family phosphatase [Anaerolineaceae bacterium]|nr:HAD family phosphatase [Anaerolineaceae bacterium]
MDPFERPKKQAILWDLDGVLIDTGEFHYRSWEETLPGYGIPFSRELFRQVFGMNNTGTLTRLAGHTLPADLIAEISRKKEENFRTQIRGQAELLPGVAVMLSAFHEAGLAQAVASSAPQENIDALIDELNIRRFFDAVIAGFRFPSKPDPRTFLAAAEALRIPPTGCLVIEDSVAGVEGARHAGMKCVAVTTTNPAEALTAADRVVAHPDDLSLEDYLKILHAGE